VRTVFRYLVTVLLFVPLVFFFVSGCENPIEKGGDKVINAMKRSQAVADSATLSTLNNAAQSYRSMNGKYPESIEELEHFAGETIDREKFEYDPATGKVSVK